MKHLIVKDRNLRKLIKKNDKKIFLGKFLNKNNSNLNPNKLNNRCLITGRVRATSRFFNHSRIVLRTKSLQGEYPGVSKSS